MRATYWFTFTRRNGETTTREFSTSRERFQVLRLEYGFNPNTVGLGGLTTGRVTYLGERYAWGTTTAAPEAETLAAIVHEDNNGQACTHASVTEMEVCIEIDMEAAILEAAAEIRAEGAWLRWAEGGWDTTGEYSYDPADYSMV